VLWANLNLLFWLSLLPFVTGWMGENHFAPLPTAIYGVVLLAAAISYLILQRRIIAVDGPNSLLGRAIGGDWKGKVSPLLYVLAIVVSFWLHWLAQRSMSWLRSFGWCLTRVSNEHSRKKLRRNNGTNGINGTHGNRGEGDWVFTQTSYPFFPNVPSITLFLLSKPQEGTLQI